MSETIEREESDVGTTAAATAAAATAAAATATTSLILLSNVQNLHHTFSNLQLFSSRRRNVGRESPSLSFVWEDRANEHSQENVSILCHLGTQSAHLVDHLDCGSIKQAFRWV